MEIYNVRIGHATNSSSAHSLLLLPNHNKCDSDLNYWDDGIYFGWENFVAASDQVKAIYLGVILKYQLERMAPPSIVNTILKEWMGIDPELINNSDVDHQSVFRLPFDWSEKGPDKEFFDAFKEFLMRKDLIILGGNDNSEGHYLADESSFNTHEQFDGCVCRYDKASDYWSLFNRNTGAKFHVSFTNQKGIKRKPAYSEVPELVDIKITNNCARNCAFCYQDSIEGGRHADTYRLKRIADALSEMKCFEVALGGGEPVSHPDFVNILEDFRYKGVVPNFTTKETAWLYDKNKRDRILNVVGGIAISVASLAEARKAIEIIEDLKIKSKISIQYVMGTTPLSELRRILIEAKKAYIRVTLLGFKRVGRGTEYSPTEYKEWVRLITELHNENQLGRISIDTSLASEFKEDLAKADIPDWCLQFKEGDFSMYIDAVYGFAGPSSFCAKEDYKKVVSDCDFDTGDTFYENILEVFRNR